MIVSRRGLLLAGVGGLVVASCGSDGSEGAAPSTTAARDEGFSLARVFSPQQPAGVEVRLPLAVADAEGVPVDDPPEELSVRITPAGGGEPVDSAVIRRHDEGVPRPYFPLTTTFPTPGNWLVTAEVAGGSAETGVVAMERSELPAVPVVGEGLVSLPTPTVDDARGVNPICTADPQCPLHSISLDTAVDSDRAVALLISTPAFCQTAICGPVLEMLVARQADFAERVTMIHAEVYRDDSAQETTDTVAAYGLVWEPSLFLARPDGTITSRLDYTFDAAELDTALAGLVG